jgi:predicted transcriptional regulator
MQNADIYLRAMMSLVARQTFPPDTLASIVSPVANTKTYETYNLFDGTRTQAEVAKALSTDHGLLSRTVKRWMDEGIMIKVVDEGAVRPVHVYPVPDRLLQAAKKKARGPSNDGRTDSAEA